MSRPFEQTQTGSDTEGFSLVETLVAISILLTVVSSIMLLVNQSIESSGQLSDQLTASYLASDAIEYIRYDRDSYLLADNQNEFHDWLSQYSSGGQLQIDTRVGSAGIQGGCCNALHLDSSKRYGYGSGEETKFTRKIEVTPNNLGGGSSSTDEAIIEVTVEWQGPNGRDSDLVLKDVITAWGE